MLKSYFVVLALIFDLSPLAALAQGVTSYQNSTIDDEVQLSGGEKLNPIILTDEIDKKKLNDPKYYSLVLDENAESTIPENELPRIRSQDSTPLCQSFCPTVIAEFFNCKQLNVKNCNTLPDSDRISPISTMRYRDNVEENDKSSIAQVTTANGRKTYEVMNSISSTGGKPFFFSEACAPFDKFVEGFEFDPIQINNFWSELEAAFVAVKKNIILTEADILKCPECMDLLNKINGGFKSLNTPKGLANALKAKTFNAFIYNAIFEKQVGQNPDCKGIFLKKKIRASHFPGISDKETTLNGVFERATQILNEKLPVVISSVCSAKTEISKKCDNHCFVLTGRKTVRKVENGKQVGPPIELVKIHGSWGKEWQTDNNDGWVRMDKLKQAVRTSDDKTASKPGHEKTSAFLNTISWFKESL
jgi:hypothetical protein